MRLLPELFQKNRQWAEKVRSEHPDFFTKLTQQQSPHYLWIGCADSRVPANEIIGLLPGEVFVHRNVANVVIHTDINALSCIEYAVCVLKVEHIIVCGHYGCGGVKAAQHDRHLGLIDNWLRHIRDVRWKHEPMLQRIESEQRRFDKLCELNVIEQVNNVCSTTIVQQAWAAGQSLAVHGWIYRLEDGLLQDLNTLITNSDEISSVYRLAIEQEAQKL